MPDPKMFQQVIEKVSQLADVEIDRPKCGTCVWAQDTHSIPRLVVCPMFEDFWMSPERPCCPHHQNGTLWAMQEARRREAK